MNDFDWINDFEPFEYYIIGRGDDNRITKRFRDDEWVLLRIRDNGSKIEYEIVYYNLRPKTQFGVGPYGTVDYEWFNTELKGKYWQPVKELPQPTLFGHVNNKRLSEYKV